VVTVQADVSKSVIEQVIGRPVVDFAYPYGSYSAATIPLIRAAGFADAMTMDAGDSQYANDLFRLQRVRVGGTDTPESVAAKALLLGSVKGGAAIPGVPIPRPQPGAAVAKPVDPRAVRAA
jgi:peptidoglycan/xylan/chitin deacetylase (PgdA/CDA1 family)